MIHWFGNKKHTRPFIPQIEPWIDGKELKQLKRVIKSTYVVENKLTAEFENIVANLAGAKHAVAMTNGTAALFCALKSLGIGAGDEVLVPNLTFVASANAVTLAGAKPIFCEIDERTMQICPNKLPIYLSDRTAAIMPVHLYGQAADMDLIMRFCRKNGLKCIEDAAQGVGVKFNGQHVGTFGDIGVFSYYGNKTITCGEGGVVVTNNDDLKTQCYRLKNHGRDTKGIFEHEHVGYNFAFTDMQAAIGIAQMGKLEKIISKKKKVHDRYVDGLSCLYGKFNPTYFDPRSTPVHWFTSFLTDDRDDLMSTLRDSNIQTRMFFMPLHMQPCYKKYRSTVANYPVSEYFYKRGISLPSSFKLKWKDQKYIINKIKSYYGISK